jgi:hypothetical protein
MEGFDGVTVIETNAAAVIVREVDPLICPATALIVVAPTPVLVARPIVGAESLIVAIGLTDDVQFTELVMS